MLTTKAVHWPGLGSCELALHSSVDRYISDGIARDGTWEPFETEIILSLLESGDAFVDLGANLGWYTVWAARKVGARGRVFAFEPDPNNLKLLEINVTHNGLQQVHVIPAACGASAGQAWLYLSQDNLGDHRLYDSGESRSRVSVRQTTLDHEFVQRSQQSVRVVKFDTQGSESNIVRGGEHFFSGPAASADIVMEFWPFGLSKAGADVPRLIEWIFARSDHVFTIEEHLRKLVPISASELEQRAQGDLAPNTGHFANLLIVSSGEDVSQWT